MTTKTLTSEWGWPEMEELLQCPVCFDPPNGIVEQCVHGHHICSSCKLQVDTCPLCKSRYTGTRNFVVEELIRNLEVVKNTMLLSSLSDEANKNCVKGKKSKTASKINYPPIERVQHIPTPSCTKGIYPCRVAKCKASLPLARLLNHVRTFHDEKLTEDTVDVNNIYGQTWVLTYKKRKNLTKITYPIFVSGIGLIFLLIEIFPNGELVGVAQLAIKYAESRKFYYELKVHSEHGSQSYASPMTSCKRDVGGILNESKCLLVNQMKFKSICGPTKKFNLTISIARNENSRFPTITGQTSSEYKRVAELRASLIGKEQLNNTVNDINMMLTAACISGFHVSAADINNRATGAIRRRRQ